MEEPWLGGAVDRAREPDDGIVQAMPAGEVRRKARKLLRRCTFFTLLPKLNIRSLSHVMGPDRQGHLKVQRKESLRPRIYTGSKQATPRKNVKQVSLSRYLREAPVGSRSPPLLITGGDQIIGLRALLKANSGGVTNFFFYSVASITLSTIPYRFLTALEQRTSFSSEYFLYFEAHLNIECIMVRIM
jgi:hypothetical protein